jgi:hypothetical protein
MNINAIGPIYPVRADRIHPPGIGTFGYPYPSDALQSLALNRAERVARPSPVNSPALETLHEHASAIRKARPVQELDAGIAPAAGQTIDWLRNQFAAHRLTSAVQAFQDEHAADKDHAAGLDINSATPEPSFPIPKYLVAFGSPPIEQIQPAIATQAGSARVGPIANVAAARSTTDDALGADAATRARVRRPRESDA